MRLLCCLGMLLAVPMGGCERPDTGVAQAARRSEPYLDAFGEFCRWARRAHEGRLVVRDRAALAETTFAPVRHVQGVLAAWLVRPDAPEHGISMPVGTPLPAGPWVAVRNARSGTVHVASFGHCPIDLPSWWRRGADGACVLLGSDINVSGETVRVVVAFKDDADRQPVIQTTLLTLHRRWPGDSP